MSVRGRSTPGAMLAALWIATTLLGACRPREEIAEIEVAGFGTIRFRFHADAAPRHVEAFKQLARAGHYDGSIFHRVAPGFLIQGGNRESHAAPPIPALAPEPSALRHGEGSVSMVTAADPTATRTGEFFIVLRDHADWKTELDGRHTIFGQVIAGLDVAQKIAWTPRDAENRPLQPVVMTHVRIAETDLPR